jgi:DNA-binding response OmpR family regulator
MSDSALERPHLAIVSDDLSLSHFLSEGLLYEGFWTSAIGSGLQFLEVLRLRSFDAVLLDAGLGDISVVEVIRRMRGTSDRAEQGAPRSEMPAIVIVGYPGEIARSEVFDAGGQELLEPPLEIVDVANIVRSALDQAGT